MMNYKRIFKSRSLRLKILRLLSFVPDTMMLEMQYFIKTGRKLNLKSPQRFTEKLQWYKLYYRNPLMIQCVDKYDVREYVKSKGLGHILNECYGVFDRPEDINWNALPQKFVMKDTLGGGGNAVVVVRDKSKADIEALKKQAREWVNISAHVRDAGREWPYYSGKNHRIIIEKYIESDTVQSNFDLKDYKFFCFNGIVGFVYLMENYANHHELGRLGFLTKDFILMNAHRKDFAPIVQQPQKPMNYEKMVEMAKILSSDFPHVRVDFYNVDGKIIFGELTFFTASGYMQFEPEEFDAEIGSAMNLRAYAEIQVDGQN